MQAAREKALSLVGQGYIYGAKGQICSPAFRQQQAGQYPEQADNILRTGAKWDGVPVWDCAQLTRACAKAAGYDLPSGATSQWTRSPWAQTGDLASLPQGQCVFLYRQSGGRMQHTGIALGDGTCVHARGTAYGVVRQNMDEYAWTHWAALQDERPALYTAAVTAATGSTVNLRAAPGGSVITRIPLGEQAEVTAETAGWSAVRVQGLSGWMQSAFLTRGPTLEDRVANIEQRLDRAGL